ncbi:unnamed protein product [Closterium sp. NIES-54]
MVQQHLHKILLEIGFKQLPHDPGMYRLRFNSNYILLTVYVDNLRYTGTSNELLDPLEQNQAQRVDIIINHKVTQFLGLNITYAPEAIHPSASKYAEQLGERFKISHAPFSTPYRTPSANYKPNNKPLSPAGLQLYQQQLGCLVFASVPCRPDLSYIANQHAQYSRKPVAENQLDLERALQYFVSMPDIGLSYSTLTSRSGRVHVIRYMRQPTSSEYGPLGSTDSSERGAESEWPVDKGVGCGEDHVKLKR